MSIRISETDEIGNTLATYVQSVSPDGSRARVDIIRPRARVSLWKQGIDVFLPTGYPHSVSEDYLEYQIYDSLQAFASSIAGLLASRAVLEGVGVGDASASPTAALLLTILQESMGRIATILFAHRLGTALEPECKMFRLLADVLNDLSMILDCVSPVFPKPVRVLILGGSSTLRALCGVAAGSSKASLSAHFARSNNLAELNAKDSSQETVISLLGMAMGGVVVSFVTSPFATWITLLTLLSVHLWMNHSAVRAVVMRSLNRQRATIVLSHYIAHQKILSPEEVAGKERIFRDGSVVRSSEGMIIGRCKIGGPLIDLVSTVAGASNNGRSFQLGVKTLADVLSQYSDEQFVIHVDDRPLRTAYIVLKANSDAHTQLKAWYTALSLLHNTNPSGNIESWTLLWRSLLDAGWTDLDTPALETLPGRRILVTDD